MGLSLKENILKLRKEGKLYKEICDKLNCSKATVSYHCINAQLGDNYITNNCGKLSKKLINEINDYYKTHTGKQTALKFNISLSTVKRYTEKKLILLSNKEKKEKNYSKIKSFRQKIKEKSVEYKGGKCEICDYDKCITALEFHHLNPKSKDFGIGNYSTLGWDKIKNEINKCILVCANCHREIHYGLIDLTKYTTVYPSTDTR